MLFLKRRRNRGVVCVCFIFDAGGSVCGCMCVRMCTSGLRAHTRALHMGYSDVSPGVQDETPGGPEESRWTKS